MKSIIPAILTMGFVSAVHAAGAAPVSCAALASLKPQGTPFEIVKAEVIPAAGALPAHCRVEGVMDKRTGRDGKPYAIRFAVSLPDEWNGRFMYQGGGGLNGTLAPPLGNRFSGDTSSLAQGFAIASTDSGHSATGFDATFMDDQEAALNFLYQANAKVTVVAKQIVAARYGRPSHHSYWVGCSTGGREGMMMSQRFPDYFDGIVAGAPAMRTNYSNLALRWMTTNLNAIAPKDAQGRPETNKALSESDRKLVIDALRASCDATDGSRDGLLFATQSCHFDPHVLACKAEKSDDCISAAQADAISRGMQGPKTSSGQQVYPGFYYDTGIANTRGLAGLLVGPVIPEGPAGSTTMDVDAAAAQAHDGRAMLGDTNAWTNLSGFRSRGGKLIFFHGVSDPWFSALDTVQYYQRLEKDNAPARTADWSRLFLVPGMGHCAGGEATLDSFNMVDAIVNWVEKNTAPEQVIAKGASLPGQTRPLCPFPKHAQYNGSGDDKSAASYQCME
jgi:pimeloyl-ACP methyl ester carboxylesterase